MDILLALVVWGKSEFALAQILVTQRLTEAEITTQLATLSDWQRQDQSLTMTHRFSGFVEAMNFAQCLVEPAEQLGHHPDLEISYNTVRLTLTTHDAGGLTSLDFQLAQQIDQVLAEWTSESVCR
ncbi:MAG: 4a-hydroxytetrahydrobiopterin dehydratase [Microcoleaceae cyanobacterium]